MPLAFLNLGPAELALLLLLFLLLFGVDKAPDVARSLGHARARLERAQGELQGALETEEEKARRELIEYERMRESVIAREGPPAREALVREALRLGVDPGEMSDDELRAALDAARARGGADAGGKGSENAADAQQ